MRVAARYPLQKTEISKSIIVESNTSMSVKQIVELGKTKPSNAIPELVQALESDNGIVRRLAVLALGKIRDVSAVGPLLDLLERETKAQVKQFAIQALGAIGDNRAENILQRIADNEDEINYMRDSAKAAIKQLRRSVTTSHLSNLPQPPRFLESSNHVEELIIECINSLPGVLPRSGVAKLLVGSKSKRVEDYQSHSLYNCLENLTRTEVMVYVDKLLEKGILFKNKKGNLLVRNIEPLTKTSAPLSDYVLHSTQLASPSLQPTDIESFLTKSHPRPLTGPWQTGWALGFHSRISGGDWSRSDVGDLTYRLKYESDTSVLPALVQQALDLLHAHPEMNHADFVIPVPSSTERKINPVYLFCEALAGKIDLSMQKLVTKTRQTQPQKEMKTLAQKRANVANAFSLRGDVIGKSILLVDDLFDSGATLAEITRLLLKHGASFVNVLTLTRTIHSDA